jgi:penicillin-binding protein 1C
MLLFSACNDMAQQMVGVRPASRLPNVVEAYLEKYQPGPLPRLFQTTFVYDRNGVQIAELFEEGRRTWVSSERISPFMIDATIATEDATFRTNLGIDPFRIIAAFWNNTTSGTVTSGASTITMQLARNLFLGPDQRYNTSMDRKMLEAGLAQELNALYTKNEIMEMYLNLLNYGSLAYGPEAAAQVYFGKHASDLTLAEATFLVGIPQQPSVLNPYHNFNAVKQRQRVVLDLMVRHLFLDKRQADVAWNERIVLKGELELAPSPVPHFVQYLIETLDAQLGQNYTRRAGFNLFTTLDMRIQNLAQKLISERVAKGRQLYNMDNGALVALKPGTGEILAMVGSADFNDASIGGQVNVALMPRQPGSAIKPILYATAFNELLLSPASVMWDTPVAYDLGAGQYYRPQNYDNKFHGLVTARMALANSFNIPVVRLLDMMGMARTLKGAAALGVRSLDKAPDKYTLTLALGGHEMTLMDLVTAYHTIANGGQYIPPAVVQTFLDSQSQLIHPLPDVKPVTAISPGAAFLVTDILSDNVARSTMFGLNSPLKLSRPAAAKTGTTTDFRDNWTVGFTRYLLTGVWVGNSHGQPMEHSTGISGAAPIWHDFMEAILKDHDLLATLGAPGDDPSAWNFTAPPDVERRPDCPLQLACRTGGEYFTKEWLQAAGDNGPLADTFVTELTVPVHRDLYGNAWAPIYCATPEGEKRKLLRLTDAHGLLEAANPAAASAQPTSAAVITATSALTATQAVTGADGKRVIMFYPDRQLERLRKLQWARARGMAVNVGACDTLSYYSVQPGEFWGLLSDRFSLTVGELQAANPQAVREAGVLHPGDHLLIPNGIPIDIGQGELYTVQDGDSWFKIATQFAIPLRLLQTVNVKVVRANFILQPGDQLYVPHLTAGQLQLLQ